MSEATEQDWEVADEVAQQILNGVLVHSVVRDRIAVVLAVERAKGVEPCDCRLAEHGLHRLGCPWRGPEQCASTDNGDRCDLPAGHVGRHEHTKSRQWEPETVALEDLFPPRMDER